MTIDDLDELLEGWHRWSQHHKPIGAIKRHPMWGQVKSSRTWDSLGEVIDSVVEDSTMEAVDFAVGSMPDQQRTALQIEAKNIHTGYEVWRSARLPSDPQERRKLVYDARAALGVKLLAAGVIQND